MKKALIISAAALITVGATIVSMTEANAVVCARGVYRAGCVGPRGGVVAHRPIHRPYHRGVVVRRRYY